MVQLASLDAPPEPSSDQIGTKPKNPTSATATSTATQPVVDDHAAQVKLNELFSVHFLPIFYELTSSSLTSDLPTNGVTNTNNGNNSNGKSSTSVVWSRDDPQMAAFDALIRLVPAQAWVHHELILGAVIPQVSISVYTTSLRYMPIAGFTQLYIHSY